MLPYVHTFAKPRFKLIVCTFSTRFSLPGIPSNFLRRLVASAVSSQQELASSIHTRSKFRMLLLDFFWLPYHSLIYQIQLKNQQSISRTQHFQNVKDGESLYIEFFHFSALNMCRLLFHRIRLKSQRQLRLQNLC